MPAIYYAHGAPPGTAQNIAAANERLAMIAGFIWNFGDIAGNQGKLAFKLDLTKALRDAAKDYNDHLTYLYNKHLSPDSWNDLAGQAVQARIKQLLDDGDKLVKALDEKLKVLQQFIDQIGYFNDCFRQFFMTIGASLLAMGATSWIPVVDLVSLFGGSTEVAVNVDNTWNLVNVLKVAWAVLRSGFWRVLGWAGSNLPMIYRNFVVTYGFTQEPLNFGLRFIERWVLIGNPLRGWSAYDAWQIQFANLQNALLTSLFIGPVRGGAPYGWLGQVSRLNPSWWSFARSSGVRLLQIGGTATLYNFVNLGLIQGKGWNFNIPNSLLRGTGISLAVATVVIVGGNALVFWATRGSGSPVGLPQWTTIPASLLVNGFFDVGIPGFSPLVRAGRGYVYVTAATHVSPPMLHIVSNGQDVAVPLQPAKITPDVLQAVQQATGIGIGLPTQTVGSNDTLDDIIRRQYGNANVNAYHDAIVALVVQANHLNGPTDIYTGEKLVMPSLPTTDYLPSGHN